jgi:hypothetical protein
VTYIVGQARRPDTWHRTRRRKISSPLGIADGWWLKKMPSDGWWLKENLIIFLIILWWLTYGKCIWLDDLCRTRNVNQSQLGILVWMWLNPIPIDATSLNINDLLGFTKTISAGHAYITRVCVCVWCSTPYGRTIGLKPHKSKAWVVSSENDQPGANSLGPCFLPIHFWEDYAAEIEFWQELQIMILWQSQ